MVNSNKILTVSYGTFSCTLEGFDDSFGTMKAIAEYFRDLAADDRFFGAEPPQPDAEMMAVIAQREASRPVRASRDDSGIVLRAADTVGAATVPAAAAAFSRIAADEPVIAEAVETAPVADPASDPVSQTVAHPDTDVETNAGAEPAAHADTQRADATADVQPDTPTEDPVAPSVDDTTAADEIAVVEDVQPEAQVQQASDMTAKLDRIRAVVAQNQDQSYDDIEEIEETPEALNADLEAAASIQAEAMDEPHDSVSISAVLDQIEDDAETVDLTQTDEDLDDESLFADLDDTSDDTTDITQTLQLEAKDRVPPQDASPEDTAPLVLVKKVKRSDVDAALASGLLQEIEEDAEDTVAPAEAFDSQVQDDLDAAAESSSLSQEDEEDLLRELAAVEAEFVEIEIDTDTADDDQAGSDSVNTANDAAFFDADDAQADDVDVSRLMDAADAKLDDPDSNSNAEAYTHLRAAVVAAEAEREAGGDVEAATPEAPFREDLAQVVKPRRPERPERSAREEPAELPAPRKVAPLKLVAEQRIVETESATPVRPRRVIAPAEIAETDENNSGFLEFMAGVDAIGLEEQLEAAAAYLTYVEKRDGFTRPQLMNKVRVIHPVDFNREDGLRAFGKLLRTGKLVKSGGGRFVASSEIGYQPGERAAI